MYYISCSVFSGDGGRRLMFSIRRRKSIGIHVCRARVDCEENHCRYLPVVRHVVSPESFARPVPSAIKDPVRARNVLSRMKFASANRAYANVSKGPFDWTVSFTKTTVRWMDVHGVGFKFDFNFRSPESGSVKREGSILRVSRRVSSGHSNSFSEK